MKVNRICLAASLIITNFSHAEPDAEISNIFVVSKRVEFKHVKKINVSIDGKIKSFILPGVGAREETFAMAIDRWSGVSVINFMLDARGQMPAIAYFGYDGRNTCFIGQYSRLIFEKESNLVIESLHSSASEQIVNRYDFNQCTLKSYDQLMDKAIISGTVGDGSVKRVVTKLKGNYSKKFRCEYSIEQGRIVDPDKCFKR